MRFPKPISVLVATIIAVGCSNTEPPSVPANREPARTSTSDAEVAPSVKKRGEVSAKDLTSDAEIVQADIRANLNAVYQGDIDTVLGYTHPKIIAMMGGTANAKSVLQALLSKTQAAGMSLDSLTFPDSPRFVETDANCFAIIPTKSVIVAYGQRVESLNYQFGVRATGDSKWTYIEGSRVNQQNVRMLFPDFPTDVEFPECYRKKI